MSVHELHSNTGYVIVALLYNVSCVHTGPDIPLVFLSLLRFLVVTVRNFRLLVESDN